MKLSKIQRSVLWVGRDGHPFGIAEGLWYAMDELVQAGLVEFLGVGDDKVTGHYKVTESGAEIGYKIAEEMHEKFSKMSQKREEVGKKQEYPVKIAWYGPFIRAWKALTNK